MSNEESTTPESFPESALSGQDVQTGIEGRSFEAGPVENVPVQNAADPNATVENVAVESEALSSERVDAIALSTTAELRARLTAQFERWLDQTLAEEPPPRGIPESLLAEASQLATDSQPTLEADLYTLFSSLTGLTGEIKLQGRAFKQLTDLLTPLAETPKLLGRLYEAQNEWGQSLASTLEAQATKAAASPVSFKQICDVMIDLYDRLQRGLQTCDEGIAVLKSRPRPGRLARLFGAVDLTEPSVQSVQALRDAGTMTLSRLQAALQEWGIERIGQVGEAFDPETMTVVDVCKDESAEPGTVLIVNRSGYALNGEPKATAQVTVSKADI